MTAAGGATGATATPPALDTLGRVHLIGVGGAGMSAVALLLAARGVPVSGSDARDSAVLAALREAGVRVHVGHDAAHVAGVHTVVVSSAIRETNPELAAARSGGLRVLHRSVALAALMAGRRTVAVAGAHGKTTTSAMVAAVLVAAGRDPSYAIGAAVDGPVGARPGAGDAFVAEADESDGSFLAYAPEVAVVTNVEPDHLDHYGTREAFEAAFVAFAGRIVPGGSLVACADDDGARRLAARVAADDVPVITYGTAADAVVRMGPWVPAGEGGSVAVHDTRDGTRAVLELQVPGAHNGLDAAAAWTAARLLGVPSDVAVDALAGFRGTGRRFEARGERGGVRVVDDYAHHPTEVAALLRAARTVAGNGRVLVLFQPHLYSRTRTFAREFAEALATADLAVVTDVYAAREDPDPTVTGALITEAMPAGRGLHVPGRLEAATQLGRRARPGDLVLTVGAGDVTELAPVVLAAVGTGDGGA
ncbi:UDP-N-acetylmuramate--alanine ligase, partial [Actinotalea fermentans ATCC 43279 = JCM 9966 = DSM 3133]